MHLPDVGPYWRGSVLQTIPASLREEGTMPASQQADPAPAPGAPVAQDSPYPYADPPAFPTASAPGRAACRRMPAWASTAARARTGSASRRPPASAPNDCAGQGYCATATDHTCHVQNDCRDQGGCGLYGTDEELDQPGDNDCRSLGSCATPINAERFSTNGPNRGKSVWLRARAVFEAECGRRLREELLAQQARGEVAADQPLPEEARPAARAVRRDRPDLFLDQRGQSARAAT